MASIKWEKVLELVAGKAATRRYHDNTFQLGETNDLTISPCPKAIDNTASIKDTPRETTLHHSPNSPETSCSLLSIPTIASGSSIPVHTMGPRPQLSRTASELSECARSVIFERQQRSLLSFDHLLNATQASALSTPHPLIGSRDGVAGDTAKPSPAPGSTSVSEAPFIYRIPPRPRMVGVGRFRRSETAPAEWWAEKLRKESLSIPSSSSIAEKAPISASARTSFSSFDNTGPDTETQNTMVSDDGVIVMRGFRSRRSSCYNTPQANGEQPMSKQTRQATTGRPALPEIRSSGTVTTEATLVAEVTVVDTLQLVRDIKAKETLEVGNLPSVWSESTCSVASNILPDTKKPLTSDNGRQQMLADLTESPTANTDKESFPKARITQLDGSTAYEDIRRSRLGQKEKGRGRAGTFPLSAVIGKQEIEPRVSPQFQSLLTEQIANGALAATTLSALNTKRRPSKPSKGGRKVRFQRRATAMPRLGG